MKYVTLTEFLKLLPNEQRKVTLSHLAILLASEEDRVKMRSLKEGKEDE